MTGAPGVRDPRLLTFGDGDPPPLSEEGGGFLLKGYPPGLWVRAVSRERRSEGGTRSGTPLGPQPRAEESSLPGRASRPSERSDRRRRASTASALGARRVRGVLGVLLHGRRCRMPKAMLHSRSAAVGQEGGDDGGHERTGNQAWSAQAGRARGSLRRARASAGPAGASAVAHGAFPRRTGGLAPGRLLLRSHLHWSACAVSFGWPLRGRRCLMPAALLPPSAPQGPRPGIGVAAQTGAVARAAERPRSQAGARPSSASAWAAFRSAPCMVGADGGRRRRRRCWRQGHR